MRLQIRGTLMCVLLILVSCVTGFSQDRIQRGGGVVQVDGSGGVKLGPAIGQGLVITYSCFGATVSAANQIKLCYDAPSGVLRASANGAAYQNITVAGAAPGTVTSVDLTLPSIFNVTGGPITTAGTFNATLANQSANFVFAGPTTGADAAPTFRALVQADIPSLNASAIGSGILPVTRGGTGLSGGFTFGAMFYANNTNSIDVIAPNTAATRKFLTQTGDGVFSATPLWSALSSGDIPEINLSSTGAGGASGVLPFTHGGTGRSTLGNAGEVLSVDAAGTGLAYRPIVSANSALLVNVTGTQITLTAQPQFTGQLSATSANITGTAGAGFIQFTQQSADASSNGNLKLYEDSGERFAIRDPSGGMAAFNLSNIASGTKRVFTWPDADGTVALTSSLPTYARVTGANATTSSTTLVDVTGLSLALAANTTYEVYVSLSSNTSADANGIQYALNYSAAGASVEAQLVGTFNATSMRTDRLSAFNSASSNRYLQAASQDGSIVISGTVTTGANAGNLTVQHLKNTSGTSTVRIGSFLKVVKIS